MWGAVDLSREMGVVASMLIDEYERRVSCFGIRSRQVSQFCASELGFEHNLGLLCKAYEARQSGKEKQGILEYKYYLQRCLLEAEGSGLIDRGALMCASIVGDAEVQECYQSVFSKHLVSVPLVKPLPVPEIWVHPATTVGADISDVEDIEGFGFCYLALIQPSMRDVTARSLGPEPTLRGLVEFASVNDVFLPEEDLSYHSLDVNSRGYHVVLGGKPGFDSVLQAVEKDPTAKAWRVQTAEYLDGYGIGADAGDILCNWLSTTLGKSVRLSENSLDLVTNSAALLDTESKKRLRSLEAFGDSVLSMALARDNFLRGEPVERYQNLRSNVTSNKVLTDRFVRHVPVGAVRFLPNVNPAAGVTGAKALESILGVVWLELGDEALATLLISMGFLEFSLQVRPPDLLLH